MRRRSRFLERNLAEWDRELRVTLSAVYLFMYFGLYITGPYTQLAYYLSGYYTLTGILGFSPLYYLIRIGTRRYKNKIIPVN